MTNGPLAGNTPVIPKDVFRRPNMPSRWERLTGVFPKTPPDRKYLAFVAARSRRDKQLPHPYALAIPESSKEASTPHRF